MEDRKCKVVQDLLPLYIDEVVSEETREFVDEHLEECDTCKQELDMLTTIRRSEVEAGNEIAIDDGKMLKTFHKKLRKKQLIIAFVSCFVAAVVTAAGLWYYHRMTRPDINGNEMFLSEGLAADGRPINIIQNKTNGLVIEKSLGEAYISVGINNDKMKACHIQFLKDNKVIEDTMLKVGKTRMASYHLKNLEDMESGTYNLVYYDSRGAINQYRWLEIK